MNLIRSLWRLVIFLIALPFHTIAWLAWVFTQPDESTQDRDTSDTLSQPPRGQGDSTAGL